MFYQGRIYVPGFMFYLFTSFWFFFANIVDAIGSQQHIFNDGKPT